VFPARRRDRLLFPVLFSKTIDWQATVGFELGKRSERMFTHSPRAFPLGVTAPVGTLQSTQGHSRLPRARRPRPRICLRKGCRRQYQPRRWNQRYCQDPHCQREVRRWQAARRQAKRRQDPGVQAQHAQAEKQRRHRAKTTPKAIENPEVAPARGHAAGNFFAALLRSARLLRTPVSSPRNPARYCGAGCRQAVRNVRDRERKWLARGTLDGRKKRAIEYQAARRHRGRPQPRTAGDQRSRPPPPGPRLPPAPVVTYRLASAGCFSLGLLC